MSSGLPRLVAAATCAATQDATNCTPDTFQLSGCAPTPAAYISVCVECVEVASYAPLALSVSGRFSICSVMQFTLLQYVSKSQ